jgi:hypothetical protein
MKNGYILWAEMANEMGGIELYDQSVVHIGNSLTQLFS